MLIVPLSQIHWDTVTQDAVEDSRTQSLTETAQQQQLTYSAGQIENMIDETLQAAGIPAEKIQVRWISVNRGAYSCNEVEIQLQDLQKESEARYLVQSMVGKEAEVKFTMDHEPKICCQMEGRSLESTAAGCSWTYRHGPAAFFRMAAIAAGRTRSQYPGRG